MSICPCLEKEGACLHLPLLGCSSAPQQANSTHILLYLVPEVAPHLWPAMNMDVFLLGLPCVLVGDEGGIPLCLGFWVWLQ